MERARLEETIIALSTPPGPGGLGVIRLSGPDSLAIAFKIFIPSRKSEGTPLPRTAVFGHVRDEEDGRILDEAFLTHFPGPRSYTREDVVEISCHGSPAVIEGVLEAGVRAGAKPALPGEFTMRAYLRGRIDMLQAEAVRSLIQSTSIEQARVSFAQVRGSLSRKVGRLRQMLIELMAGIEVRIEFSEEAVDETGIALRERLVEAREISKKLAESYETGRAMAGGIRVVIAGRPNAGKSTLFNALLGRERAVVTPFPGTTRDYLSERLSLAGRSVVLTDMAGLGKPNDAAEREGMRLGKEVLDEADGIILIVDSSRRTSPDDLMFFSEFAGRRVILAFNKSDLPEVADRDAVLDLFPGARGVGISALRGNRLEDLKTLMAEVFLPETKAPDEIVLQLRQKLLLDEISRTLGEALARLDEDYSEEYIAENVREALDLIGRLTGSVAVDEVLEAVFGEFCVGK